MLDDCSESNLTLVTGGSGFIGRYLTPLLSSRKTVLWSQDQMGDIHDQRNRIAILKEIRPSSVIHLAWQTTSDPKYHLNPLNSKWAETTAAFAKECVELGTWFIGAGSAADTYESPQFDNAYGDAKRWLKTYILGLAEATTWFSPQFVFSPLDSRPRVVREFLDGASLGKFILNDPDRYLDYIHIQDVATGVATILNTGIRGAIYLGSGFEHTTGSLIEAVRRSIPASNQARQYSEKIAKASDRRPDELLSVGWNPEYTESFFSTKGK